MTTTHNATGTHSVLTPQPKALRVASILRERLGIDCLAAELLESQYARIAELEAQAQENARDMEAEAMRACSDLPEGWEIEIHLERGYGVVTLIDPKGNDDELPVDGTLFDALKESIDQAIQAYAGVALGEHFDRAQDQKGRP